MFGKMSAYFRNGRGQRGASTGSDAKNKDESLKQPLNGKLDSKVSRHNYSIGDPRNKMGDLAEEDNFAGEVCLITESPFRILKVKSFIVHCIFLYDIVLFVVCLVGSLKGYIYIKSFRL